MQLKIIKKGPELIAWVLYKHSQWLSDRNQAIKVYSDGVEVVAVVELRVTLHAQALASQPSCKLHHNITLTKLNTQF